MQSRQKTITERKSVLLHENEGLESQLRELQENQDSIEIELGTSEELEKKLKWETEEEQRVLEEQKRTEQILQKRAEEAHLLFVELGQKENFLNENQDRTFTGIYGNTYRKRSCWRTTRETTSGRLEKRAGDGAGKAENRECRGADRRD